MSPSPQQWFFFRSFGSLREYPKYQHHSHWIWLCKLKSLLLKDCNYEVCVCFNVEGNMKEIFNFKRCCRRTHLEIGHLVSQELNDEIQHVDFSNRKWNVDFVCCVPFVETPPHNVNLYAVSAPHMEEMLHPQDSGWCFSLSF